MKRGLIFAAFALLAMVACKSKTAQTAEQTDGETQVEAPALPTEESTLVVNVGDEAPDFKVTMNNGKTLRLSSLRGKVVLLTFWATWCPDCVEELAHLTADVLPKLEGKEFVFLPISTRERGEQNEVVAKFMTDKGYTFTTGLDADNSVYGLYTTQYVPRNFLIDAEGKIVATSTDVGFAEKIEAKLMEMVK